ncbi:hypothetical protein [Methanoregula sp. UBA64]|uniref:hypothetical protein n=1 Tax=Methanoregula sp. UBA64 TaxID=1915554 RepID=UPI0025D304C5|nr:hypothetical protein [Methanoregula sp. UBA64]
MPVPPVIRDDCPCPNTACRRHTLCHECEPFRAARGKVPFCREQRVSLWDRIQKILERK